MEALVSIVTPCYNGENYVSRFLKSILNQTYQNLELIFIDDGSTDRTADIVNLYRPVFEKRDIRFVYEYQENAGQAAALNRGLKLLTGEYLTWPDSDDEIMPEYIEKKVKFLQYNPEYRYCYGKALCVNEDNPEIVIGSYGKRKKNGRYDFFEDILAVNDVFFPGYLVKTSALDKVIDNREIYAGAGGQNAQILLLLGWYYGEPGYVEDSVYKYYIRSNSHSHSQNTSEKIIQQLYNYENIVTATLEKIQDEKVKKYEPFIQKYYTRQRFGNAVDTRKPELIKKQYYELKQRGANTMRDFELYVKYTNVIVRKLLQIG
jgi:glycosyltransferase involved in cell wall biosynthesis